MKRVFHKYTNWEECPAGMWTRHDQKTEADYLRKAIEFTGDAELYGEWMLKVIEAWPISCENSLSNVGMNRKAWVGHAACCLAIGSPEHVTRQAWAKLSWQQQTDANKKAEQAIKQWERNRRLKAMSEFGKNVVTWMAYPTAPPQNWKQLNLFRHIDGYVERYSETICA